MLINVKQRVLTVALNSISILAYPYWKSQGKVREFNVVWKVVTLQISREDYRNFCAVVCA